MAGVGGSTVQVVKPFDRPAYGPGDAITYTIVAPNADTPPTSVTVNDPMPAGAMVLAALAASRFTGSGTFTGSTGSACRQGSFNANIYAVLTVCAQIDGLIGDGVTC